MERSALLHGPRYRARARTRRSPRVAMASDVAFVTPTSATARKSCDYGFPAVSDPGAHHATTIVAEKIVGQHLGYARPSRGPRSAPGSVSYSACRVFQSRRLRLQFIKAGERGVEVCLVEDLAAVDPVAFDRKDVDHPPLGVEAVL